MENYEIILAETRPKKRAGRRVFKETRHPVYRGVRRRNGDKWVCELREPKNQRRIWLGTYPTPEMAARAHDVAALALRGRSACLNFADSAWRLPSPASTDPEDIRRTASEAAEIFRPPEISSEITILPSSCCDDAASVSDEKDSEGFVEDMYSEVSDMSGMLARMAEEPLMSPPRSMEIGTAMYTGESESYVDMSLWSYHYY